MSSSMKKFLWPSNWFRYDEVRKLTTGQGENYTTEWLLDYEYFRNHYKLTTIDLSRQKKLDADPKAIQQIEVVEQKKAHGVYFNDFRKK